MTKKRLGSLLFWGFFIGLFYLCSVQQNNRDNEELVEKIIKKDTCRVIKTEDVILWADGTWDTIPYRFEKIDSNHNGFPDSEEDDTLFNKILETHTDIEDCKNLIQSIEEKLDNQNVN